MLTAIPRDGARVVPKTSELTAELRRRKQLVEGPHLAEFERAFAQRLDIAHAVPTSHGRMAFYYLLEALQLPPGSEVIFPSLTSGVVPEIARLLGLSPVFADVDPRTFGLSAASLERAITGRTRVVVPTHLWGLPCDLDEILDVAARHGLVVIEDCAHALGATYRGRQVGTFGHAAFFSFQALKPLNTYGGGMAVAHDASLADAVRARAETEPAPTEQELEWTLFKGRMQRLSTRHDVFTCLLFPVAWLSSHLGIDARRPPREEGPPLHPLSGRYRRRYANVQAAIGLEGLKHLDEWTAAAQAHARRMDRALSAVPGVITPHVPRDRTHVYYQYCAYVPDQEAVSRDCIRRGVDVETRHVDVCTRLERFGRSRPAAAADRVAHTVQLPIHTSLTDAHIDRIAAIVADSLGAHTEPAPVIQHTQR